MFSPISEPLCRRTTEMIKRIFSFFPHFSSIFHKPEKGFKMVNRGMMLPHLLSAMEAFSRRR
jgi:hypothetical protein